MLCQMIWLSMMTLAVVSFQVSRHIFSFLCDTLIALLQWFFWGYVG